MLMPYCRAYTGYIDVEAKHLFFYFFESRRDPDADDVVFWLNGGPGGSSAFGLFMELGEQDPSFHSLRPAQGLDVLTAVADRAVQADKLKCD